MKFELPPLIYDYRALEPSIDEATMHFHHDKHHQAYVNKLNEALESHPELQNKTIEELLGGLDEIPEEIRKTVRNNGGGHYNHSFFWEIMRAPAENNLPGGELARAIEAKFGSFDNFKQEFSSVANGFFGSGWAWLALNKNGELEIMGMPGHDNPVMLGLGPVMVLDLWEHAYYLKYQNRRPEFTEAFWKIIDWEAVAKKFDNAQQARLEK